MPSTTTTPNWLKIDDNNFADLLGYLCRNAKSGTSDPFYGAARELLKARAETLITELSEDLSADEDELEFRVKLLGAWILSFPEKSEERVQVMFCLLNTLSQLVPEESSQKLFQLSLGVLCSGGIDYPGFAWSDIMEISPEVFAYKIIGNAKLPNAVKREVWHEGKGLLRINGDGISVMPVNRKTFAADRLKMDDCMHVADKRIWVSIDKQEKLKQSDSSDIAKIDAFTTSFRRQQDKVLPSPTGLKRYADEAEVMVRVCDLGPGRFVIETADPNYEKIRGTLHHPKGLFYYTDNDFVRALNIGDCFKAVILNREKGWFSIYDIFQDMMTSMMEEGKCYPAEYIMDHKEGSLWITNEGVPVYVRDPGSYSEGGHAYILIDLVGGNGYIRGKIDEDQSGIDEEDFEDSKTWMLRECLRQEYVVPEVKKDTSVDAGFVRILERALYNYQKTLSMASEMYKVLSCCRMLSGLTADERELDYLDLKSDYLEQLVLFTKGDYGLMKSLVPASSISGEPSIIRSVQLVDVLKEISTSGDSQLLSDAIHSSSDAMIVRIARILQSYNRIKDIVPSSTLADLKMEIIKELSLDGDLATNLDDNDDEYLGMEDKVKEFKTSFVFPAEKSQHMQANLAMQSRNVFKAICAFLNSTVGGTLYIGVSDAGYVVGIDNDLEYLKCNHDGYIRLIQDTAVKAFDKSILDFLDFDVMFDGRVVAVKVRPFDDGVVCLDTIPYKRNFGESVPMREDERVRVISTKVVTGLKTGNKLESIERAIKEHKRAVLRRYSSASGIADRKVEPFKIFNGGRSVWCYDLEEKKSKQYNLSRMAAVDVLQDGWSHAEEHVAEETDIFSWSGKKPMHIELDMDLTAKNILVDEYPDSEKYLKPVDKSGSRWILSTDILDCKAPGRFCIGLSEHIRISKGDELKKYVQEYIEKEFKTRV